MKIIFNADDFGISPGAVYGILDAYKRGVVKSTTLLANSPAFDLAVDVAKENPGLDIGAHLTLTFGSPLLQGLETLTDDDGRFRKNYTALESGLADVDMEEVERELTAQIEKILAAGLKISHFDTHHSIEPLIYPVQHKLAGKYGVSLRRHEDVSDHGAIKTPDLFATEFYADGVNIETIKKIVQKHVGTNDVVEVMTHPAFIDDILLNISSYVKPRTKELTILTSRELQSYLGQQEVEIISFRDL
ncbi:chitin disaccharide deacetylase [Listeria seeligeri]|uniref:chitin disaccharide deacetylase n=1 Tax=Listeria seeligeri TaxID=1640 RepID=UPI0010D986BF|nr:chitin disaccharide deacetylase [Listeria seeligeri]MBC1542050.1 chitin disaccharide deacetylase [Listeria seeligeri]MBC1577954.1 chitin disaccharide deacetylase [Listeria seeligeri]MBC1593738.1 chitin disaccharide deacetylase [Listeria seeligeri]MBC1731520.1 chitin disaccharide deacetylase [Listeria seeligeri]MBC1809093.1 chitin disaccharide deacetylase [Listeria seeligeri]